MILLFILTPILAFVAAVMIFIRFEKFGKAASGESLLRIRSSKNYREGKFQNVELTPDLSEGTSYVKVIKEFFFSKKPNLKPELAVPSKKTDLIHLDRSKNVMVWFGHSSYFLQVDGKRILVDPVLSGAASPISFTTRSFKGSDVYTTNDIPEFDILVITHDHWDHLDHSTIKELAPKIKKVITGLGVGAHLEHWGIEANIISELDWGQELKLDSGFAFTSVTARHFSGRGFKRAQSIWSSFVLSTPLHRIFIGGDSGYGKHFKETGKAFGPFDLAILECGQYNANWKYIHMMPEETSQAADDLQAKKFVPVHWGKFALAMHEWNDPIKRVYKTSTRHKAVMLTPMIGEKLELDSSEIFENWWEKTR